MAQDQGLGFFAITTTSQKGKKVRPEDLVSLPSDKKPKPTKEQYDKFMSKL